MSNEYLIRLQIAKRNLTVAERIRLAEKSRPAIEKAARERQLSTLKHVGSIVPPMLGGREISENKKKNETDSKLAEIAGVGKETYRKGKRVLDSGNKEIIDRMAKGELSVNAAYKAIVEGERLSIMETAMRKVDLGKILPKCKNSGVDSLVRQNFVQRGDVGGSAKKVGLRIKELERIYGIRDGSSNTSGTIVGEKKSFTQEDIAQKMEMNVRTLQNYRIIRQLVRFVNPQLLGFDFTETLMFQM